MTVDFIRAKSYEDTESTGTLKIIGLSNLEELQGKNVLVGGGQVEEGQSLQIVDDIVDSGLTLHRLLHTLEEYGMSRRKRLVILSVQE